MERILLELALLFALCVVVGAAFHWLRLPPIVGFLCAGAIVGPFSLGFVEHVELVHGLSEVGVVMLLFAVGMELPLAHLARLRRVILVGGGWQLGGTIVLGAAIAMTFGLPWNQSVFLGFLLSLSSTAVIAKILTDHGEFSAPHGRLSMGIALAQDIAVVPMMLLIPLLASQAPVDGAVGAGSGILASLRNLVILAVVLWVGRSLIAPLLAFVCRMRSRELFVLTLAAICLGFAAVTAALGMSLALGAFLAGLLIAETDHNSQAMAEVEPVRDALASLFFVSIGMLFDWRIIAIEPLVVGIALVGVIAFKALIVVAAGYFMGQPRWVCWRAGLTLAQVGEFSFVLVQVGMRSHLLPDDAERVFVVVAVLSIASTPLLATLGRRLVLGSRGAAAEDAVEPRAVRSDHAIVVGYGPTGRTLVNAMCKLGLTVVAVEQNAATVRKERDAGVPIELGDATRLGTLRSLGLERAQLVVIAVNDPSAAVRIAQQVRRFAPHVHVVARSSYIAETPVLLRAGASEVVPQELEASIELLVRVLRRFLVGNDEIGQIVHQVREEAGSIARAAPVARPDATRIAEFVPGVGIEVLRVSEGCDVAEKDLARAGVRRRTGWSVVAVRRDNRNLPVVTPETVLKAGDVVVVIGPESRFGDAATLFRSPRDLDLGSAGSGVVETPVRASDDGTA